MGEVDQNDGEEDKESELLRIDTKKTKIVSNLKERKKPTTLQENLKRDKECLRDSDENDDNEGSEEINEGFLQVAAASSNTGSIVADGLNQRSHQPRSGSSGAQIAAAGLLGPASAGSGDNQDAHMLDSHDSNDEQGRLPDPDSSDHEELLNDSAGIY